MGFGLASLISAPTLKMVAELVRKRYAPNTVTSLVPIQPVGTKRPLYIVHGAGGNVVNFYGLTTRIGADQPVYGVQAQALEVDQPALLRREDMAAHYLMGGRPDAASDADSAPPPAKTPDNSKAKH